MTSPPLPPQDAASMFEQGRLNSYLSDDAARHPPARTYHLALRIGLVVPVLISVALVLRSGVVSRVQHGLRSNTVSLASEGPASEQHIWIVRHGDKYSSYPDCPQGQPLCYNQTLMGDNPPLTPCGILQANYTAHWLMAQSSSAGPIRNIVVSPFTRTLQTSLPLAKGSGLKLKVEPLLSEAMQDQGPYRPFNAGADEETRMQLQDVA